MTSQSTLTDGILYVTLAGDLVGLPDTQQLLDSVGQHIEEAITSCAIDLSDVRYINSSGIGTLVSLLTKFRSRGGELVLINPADHPRKMLALTKLNNIFTVAADQATARQQLQLAAS